MSTVKPSSPKSRFEEVRVLVDQAANGARSATDLMTRITHLLHEKLLKYNWVGFYMMEKKHGEEPVLVLGPFQGAMTPHTRIPLHQGICGAAASTGKTVVVDDVKSDPRYLACSIETKSEIVVPVFVRGEVVGELDIDSHFHAAFGPADRDFVEHCARVVGWYMEKHKA